MDHARTFRHDSNDNRTGGPGQWWSAPGRPGRALRRVQAGTPPSPVPEHQPTPPDELPPALPEPGPDLPPAEDPVNQPSEMPPMEVPYDIPDAPVGQNLTPTCS